jgi:hypothetical protein
MTNTPSAPEMPDTNPGDIISALKALEIRGVKNKDMQKILSGVLANHEVKEWESLLAAAPQALYAIGQCFVVALSGNVGQIVQKRDKTMYAMLAIRAYYASQLIYPRFQTC